MAQRATKGINNIILLHYHRRQGVDVGLCLQMGHKATKFERNGYENFHPKVPLEPRRNLGCLSLFYFCFVFVCHPEVKE